MTRSLGTDEASAHAVDPRAISRNMVLLAASQVLAGAGSSFFFALGPLMVTALTGSTALVGLTVALQGIGRLLAGYPFGRVTDRYGRRPGILLALAIALVGTIGIGLSMNAGSLVGLIVWVLVFCIGTNGVQQLRVAAAEMYPPSRRAWAMGIVLTGSLVGVFASPLIVGLAHALAPQLGMEELALPWLICPLLIVPAMLTVTGINPDPKEIAARLEHAEAARSVAPAEREERTQPFGAREFFAHAERRTAGLAMFSAHGAMQIAMVTAPMALSHHAALVAVALSMALHTASMYGPSIPMGRLADRLGRFPVMAAGLAVEAVGSATVVASDDQVGVTAGVILVGFGWCAANIASSAITVDTTRSRVRGRAIGMLDTVAAVAGIIFPLVAGPMMTMWGAASTGALAIALIAPPGLLVLAGARHGTRAPEETIAASD